MSFAGRAGGALLATGLAATLSVGSYWSGQSVQAALADRARSTLESRHLAATVQIQGRDATVWAATDSVREQAIAAVLTVPGVRVVVAGQGTAPQSSPPAGTVSAGTSAPSTSVASPSITPTPSPTPTVSASSPTPSISASPSASTTSSTTPPVPSAPVIPAWPAIQFAGGDAVLDATDKAELHQISTYLLANAGVTVTLTGHTDSGRTEAGRQALGLARAKAAASVLTADGVQAGRITTVSVGAKDPAASNTTAQGRAQNRRVTVSMTPGS